jgi:hypothetical protein
MEPRLITNVEPPPHSGSHINVFNKYFKDQILYYLKKGKSIDETPRIK